MGNRIFKVFDGGADGGHRATYIAASAAADAESGGGGGDVPPIWRLDVRRDVQLMKAAWALLIPALGVFLFYFIGEMKDVRSDISSVDSKVSGQTATLNDMNRSLDRIEMRLDTGAGANRSNVSDAHQSNKGQ